MTHRLAPMLTSGLASFHVVIPSLPGFGFSTLPAQNATEWTVQDTARVFNTLMVDVLGYSKYMLFGSDYVRPNMSRRCEY
jgi:pimeloyl-ACP methyl ester carboxylesterase